MKKILGLVIFSLLISFNANSHSGELMLVDVIWIILPDSIIAIRQNNLIRLKHTITLNTKEDLTDHTQAIVLVWLQLEDQEL